MKTNNGAFIPFEVSILYGFPVIDSQTINALISKKYSLFPVLSVLYILKLILHNCFISIDQYIWEVMYRRKSFI